jgi:hypothetical protein
MQRCHHGHDHFLTMILADCDNKSLCKRKALKRSFRYNGNSLSIADMDEARW